MPSFSVATGEDTREKAYNQNAYVIRCQQLVVCAAAVKILETVGTFTTCFRSMIGTPENKSTVLAMKSFVTSVAKRFGLTIVRDDWYSLLTFSMFGAVLKELKEFCGFNPHSVMNRVFGKAVELFSEILELAVTDLRGDMKKCKIVEAPEVAAALDFLANKGNVWKAITEWAYVAELKMNQNGQAHPFDSSLNSSQRSATIAFLETSLKDVFTDNFRNVGLLSLLKIQCEEVRNEGGGGKHAELSAGFSASEAAAQHFPEFF